MVMRGRNTLSRLGPGYRGLHAACVPELYVSVPYRFVYSKRTAAARSLRSRYGRLNYH